MKLKQSYRRQIPNIVKEIGDDKHCYDKNLKIFEA